MGITRIMRRRLAAGRAGEQDEAGIAIVAVLGASLLVSVLLLGSLAYLQHSVRFSRLEQDGTAADAAAQSGIHDFLTRLRLDGDYLDRADPAADPSEDNYCLNPAIAGPDVTVPAASPGVPVCSNLSSSTPVGWVAVEAGAVASADTPSFHYRVVRYDSVQREVLLESVGRSRGVYRTLQARIAHPSSSDYLYFSDYELADPQDEAAYPDNPRYPGTQNTSQACGGGASNSAELSYAWDTLGTGTYPRVYSPATGVVVANCLEPRFVTGDVLDGRVHSNDTIRSTGTVGAQFLGRLSTSDPRCATIDPLAPATWASCLSEEHRTAQLTQAPTYEPVMSMPVISDLATVSDKVGCRYSGATRIIAHEDGTMTVWSKDSVSADDRLGCGEAGTGAGQLGSPDGATVPVPDDGLVYVADVSTASGTTRELHKEEIGGPAGRRLPLGTFDGTVIDKAGESFTSDVSFGTALKHAGFGNLYLEGVVDGQVTFAAAKSVVLTGDLLLAGGRHGDDVVGVVAGRAVEIFRPRLATTRSIADGAGGVMLLQQEDAADVPGWPTRYADPTTGAVEPATGIQVQAALLALDGSVRVQQWSAPGLLGELRVVGSIAQRYRGTVANQSASGDVRSGYTKRYLYDARLDGVLRPRHFPALADGIWTVIWTQEQNTATDLREP